MSLTEICTLLKICDNIMKENKNILIKIDQSLLKRIYKVIAYDGSIMFNTNLNTEKLINIGQIKNIKGKILY